MLVVGPICNRPLPVGPIGNGPTTRTRDDRRTMTQPPDPLPPTESPPAPGDDSRPAGVALFGDYLLFDEIARGGMGVVYQAPAGQPRPRRGAEDDPRRRRSPAEADVRRFRAEAEAVAQPRPSEHRPDLRGRRARRPALLHHEARRGRQPGRPLGRNSRQAARRRRRCWSKVARAVHHAHQRGILHRDLKPANVLLSCSTLRPRGRREFSRRRRLRPGAASRAART